MSTTMNRRAILAGAAAPPAMSVPAVAAVSTSAIEALWNQRLEGVARWKQANDFAREQNKKLPKLGPEWEVFGPNDPSTWLEERIRSTYDRLGLPDKVIVAHLEIEPIGRGRPDEPCAPFTA